MQLKIRGRSEPERSVMQQDINSQAVIRIFKNTILVDKRIRKYNREQNNQAEIIVKTVFVIPALGNVS